MYILTPTGPDVTINQGNTLYRITNIGTLITRILQIGLSIVGFLIFIYIIWGGIEWLTAGGDKSKTESARTKITQGIVGMVIFASVFALYNILVRFLGIGNHIQIGQ